MRIELYFEKESAKKVQRNENEIKVKRYFMFVSSNKMRDIRVH